MAELVWLVGHVPKSLARSSPSSAASTGPVKVSLGSGSLTVMEKRCTGISGPAQIESGWDCEYASSKNGLQMSLVVPPQAVTATSTFEPVWVCFRSEYA